MKNVIKAIESLSHLPVKIEGGILTVLVLMLTNAIICVFKKTDMQYFNRLEHN